MAEVEENKKPEATSRTATTGTVLSWLRQKGYGFLKANDGGDEAKDIFVHREYISMKAGQNVCLRQGMTVSFDQCTDGDKTWAENVTSDGNAIDFFRQHGEDDRQIFPKHYQGILCEFNFKARRGYVIPSQGQNIYEEQGQLDQEGRPINLKDVDPILKTDRLTIRFEDFEMKPDTGTSVYLPDHYLGMTVKFKVYKNKSGTFAATSVRQSNGEAFDGTDNKPKRARKKVDRAKEQEAAKNIDEDKVYKGLVLQCRVNAYGFILADKQHHEELATYGKTSGQLYFNNNNINTSNSPALVLAGTRVSFKISTKSGRLGAIEISNEDGNPIDTPPERKPNMEKRPREQLCDGKRFSGKVLFYDWDRTWGSIKVDNPEEFPEDVTASMRTRDTREGKSLYFHWKDINTTDKIMGINNSTKVTFTVYKDEKGVGAGEVADENGEAFCGIERRSRRRRPRRKSQDPQDEETADAGEAQD